MIQKTIFALCCAIVFSGCYKRIESVERVEPVRTVEKQVIVQPAPEPQQKVIIHEEQEEPMVQERRSTTVTERHY